MHSSDISFKYLFFCNCLRTHGFTCLETHDFRNKSSLKNNVVQWYNFNFCLKIGEMMSYTRSEKWVHLKNFNVFQLYKFNLILCLYEGFQMSYVRSESGVHLKTFNVF